MTTQSEPPHVFSSEGFLWNAYATALIEVGFSYYDAGLWLCDHHFRGRAFLFAELAARYRDAGFTIGEAKQWYRYNVSVVDAVAWANARWTPEQTFRLIEAVTGESGRPRSRNTVDDPFDTAWCDTGIPPVWALRYAAAGIPPDEALRHETRRTAGEDLTEALAVMAALRRGPS